jgi:hypothetical protein
MYVRFAIHSNDEDSGRRQGLFQALSDLEDSDLLLPHEQETWDKIYKWFRKNLRKPRRFSRSTKSHAKKVAISWFKETAKEHIARMYALAQVLQAHGMFVDVVRTERPGYIVYEDRYQVTAEPFTDTPT